MNNRSADEGILSAKIKDLPDHLAQEVDDIITQLKIHIKPVCIGKHPQLFLGAFSRFHAMLIILLAREGTLDELAPLEAEILFRNIEQLRNRSNE